MNFTRKTLVFIFALAALFICQNEIVLAGFGVSPPYVLNKNLVPGSYYEQDVYLVQSDPNVDLLAKVVVDAGDINSWIKIENGDSFTIPKGTQQFPMKVEVNVPADAKLGKYKGTITISTSPVGNEKDGVSVTLGANVAINLEVTSIQVSDFSIQNFQIPDVKKGSPINFVIKIKNDGNIANGPTKVALTFFDQYHAQQLDKQEVLVTQKIKSFETGDISVEVPNNLDAGQYWANVQIYNDGEAIVDSKIVFTVTDVVPSGEVVKSSKWPSFSMPSIPLWGYILIAAAVVIIILVIIIIFILKKKNKDNNIY